jgi:hypothetical protein
MGNDDVHEGDDGKRKGKAIRLSTMRNDSFREGDDGKIKRKAKG